MSGPPNSWTKWFPWVEFWFNSIHNASIGMSLFKAMYGREAPTIIKYVKKGTRVPKVDQLLWERDTILEDLKCQFCKAQNAMKLWADKKRRDSTFEMGDAVYLKARPYRFKSLASLPMRS